LGEEVTLYRGERLKPNGGEEKGGSYHFHMLRGKKREREEKRQRLKLKGKAFR